MLQRKNIIVRLAVGHRVIDAKPTLTNKAAMMDQLQKVLPLRPVLRDFVERSIIEEEVLGPWRELLVTFVKVAAVVAECAWAPWSVANSPDGRAPDVAVCASPCLSLSVQFC